MECDTDYETKKDGKRLRAILLTDAEWELLQDLTNLLQPFEESTTYLGGSKYITYSIMYPIIQELKKRLKPRLISNSLSIYDIENIDDVFEIEDEDEIEQSNINRPIDTRGILDLVQKTLYNATQHYFNFQGSAYKITMILDPRIKKLNFIENEDEKKEFEVELYNKYNSIYNTSFLPSNSNNNQQNFISTENNNSLFSIFYKSHSASSDEIFEYLKEDEIEFQGDPFAWWNYKKNRYPNLAKLARQYLSISATSTPSERLFSDAGNILSSKRTRLDAEFFKRIIFLKRNANCITNIHPLVNE
jgi:hypothetical protein